MFPLEAVFCPVDFSDHSRRVLSWAAALAARDRARLVVASFLEPRMSDVSAAAETLDELERGTRQQLQAWTDAAAPPGTAWARPPLVIARRGHADESILRVAHEHAVTLIVMGTHGLSGLRKLVLGSTTTCVLRRTEVPVLAVPFGAPGLETAGGGGGPLAIDRVLVATDLTPSAFEYASVGVELAKASHAALTLVHVVEGTAGWRGVSDAPTAHDRVRAIRASQDLEELADRMTPLWRVDSQRRFGVTAEEIALAAVEMRASVIVMGLLARYGVIPRRPGSVAYRVMCLSGVPVLAIPPAIPEVRQASASIASDTA